jgi:hypothetical protein
MRLTVLKIKPQKSRYGKFFYYIFLKSDEGKSFKTCAYPKFGNFRRCGWDKVVAQGIGTIIEYNSLPINTKGLLDADVVFKIVPKEAVR